MRNRWQVKYQDIRQNFNETMSQYSARFRKTAEKAGLRVLLPLHIVNDRVFGHPKKTQEYCAKEKTQQKYCATAGCGRSAEK